MMPMRGFLVAVLISLERAMAEARIFSKEREESSVPSWRELVWACFLSPSRRWMARESLRNLRFEKVSSESLRRASR